MFKDSVHFLTNLLEKLVKHLAENGFYHLSQDFNVNSLNLPNKKRYFPHDYWESFEKFKEGLPGKDKFYNLYIKLIMQSVIKIIKHILGIWKAFKMNTMKDYDDLHLKVDVSFSTCVFETF